MKKWEYPLVGALCLTFFFSLSAFAQSDVASISGFVRDASSAIVPGSKVVVKNEGVAFERTVETNNEGYYTVTGLPPGLYTVQASKGTSTSFR